MCKFLSAIAWSDGKIFCAPESTDSHSDLIAAKGLDDSRPLATRGWVRVEFCPPTPDKLADPDSYVLIIDESSVPAWLDDAMRFQIAETLRHKVRAMIVTDSRDILLGGCWILAGEAKIKKTQRSKVVAMLDSSQVGEMRGSSKVGEMWDSSKVGTMRGSSKVGTMWGSSKVGEMWDSSKVGTMWGSSKVGTMWDSSQVGTMWGSSKVGTMWGSSQVGAMRGLSRVKNDSRNK